MEQDQLTLDEVWRRMDPHMFRIVQDAHATVENLERCMNPNDADESEVLNLGFFRHLRPIYAFALITELAKLFDTRGEDVSFHKLFNELENSKHVGFSVAYKKNMVNNEVWHGIADVQRCTSKEQMLELVTRLRKHIGGLDVPISYTINVRNKRTSHTDINWWDVYSVHDDPEARSRTQDDPQSKEIIWPSLADLRKLTILAGEVWNELSVNIGGNWHVFTNANWSVNPVIQQLAWARSGKP